MKEWKELQNLNLKATIEEFKAQGNVILHVQPVNCHNIKVLI